MSAFYDDLLDETDDLVRDFFATNVFTDAFAALSCDAAAAPASAIAARISPPFVRAAMPAPVGMHALVDTATTTIERCATRATCHYVQATLRDAMQAITADGSTMYKCMETELLGSDVLVDAQVLEIVRARTKERPHDCVALKHVKYRSVLEEYQAEDFLLLETSGTGELPAISRQSTHATFPQSTHRSASPRNYAYKVLRSVDVPGADAVLAADADVRLELHRGWLHHCVVVFSETPCPGVLRLDLWVDIEVTHAREHFHGGFSSLHDAFSLAMRYRHLVEHYVSRSAGAIGGAGVAVRATSSERLTRSRVGPPLTPAQVFPSAVLVAANGRARNCQLCTKRVSVFSRKRKHVCAVCGVFVCATCATATEFNNWHLCPLCCERNAALVTRHAVARLASSSLAKLSYLTKVKFGLERHRQSLYGSHRATLLNRRATVVATRKHSGATRMSFVPKTSGKSAYDVLADGTGGAQGGDDGRGSLFETALRPSLTPRHTNPSAWYPSQSQSSSISTVSSNASSNASSLNYNVTTAKPSSMETTQHQTPNPNQMPPLNYQPMTANEYYLHNISRSYSLSKTRIQLLNDDQQSRLSSRSTWRSSVQSDCCVPEIQMEVLQAPHAPPLPPPRRATFASAVAC